MSHRVTSGHMVFAASFRTNGNLLSQWRGYSQIGKGVSIGFRSEDIITLATSRHFQLGPCIYQRDKQITLINNVIENLLYIAQERASDLDVADFDSLFNQIEADMLKIAAVLKHPSFVEEDEWRLVSPAITDYLAEPVHFREGTSMMIPFYRFPLVDKQSRKEKNVIPVKHVFVGPTPNSTLSLNSIALYLKKYGMELGDTISYCDIPYRSK